MDDLELVSREAVSTGDGLANVGDLRGARAAYDRAVKAGHPAWAPHAAIKLGDLLAARGARSLAIASYEHAINSNSFEWSRQGWLRVAALLTGKRAPAGKRIAYPETPDSAASGSGPMAADRHDPAVLLTDALKQVINFGESELAAQAAVTLGDLFLEGDDEAAALDAYRHAANSHIAEWSLRGHLKLWGLLFGADSSIGQALRELDTALGRPADEPEEETISAALGKLSELMRSLREEPATTLQLEFHPRVAVEFGDLARKDEDLDSALVLYTHAIDSGDSPHLSRALVSRGNLRWRQNDLAGARADFQKAMDTGHPENAPAAAVMLGSMLDRQGDLPNAHAAYQYAIDSANVYWGSQALVSLGTLLWRQGDTAAARDTLQKAANSPRPDTAATARNLLNTIDEKA